MAAVAVAIAASAVAARTDVGGAEILRSYANAIRAHVYCYPLVLDLAGGLRGDRTCRASAVVPR
jgi:hypothetical protein